MRNISRTHVICFATLCVVALYPISIGTAQPINRNASATDSIQFNDPEHPQFFRYQAYLTQHGKAGETRRSWDALTTSERARKVADGEAVLEKLHADLLSKEKLSADEAELFQAVWGTTATTGDNAPARELAIARENSAAGKVSAVSKDLGSFRETGSWGQLFDGDKMSPKTGTAVGAIGASANRGTEAFQGGAGKNGTVTPRVAGVPPVVPGAGEPSNDSPIKKTLPLAGGVVLLAGAYIGYRKWRTNTGKLPGNSAEFPRMDDVTLDELGRPILPPGVLPPNKADAQERVAEGNRYCVPNSTCTPTNSTCTPPSPQEPCAPPNWPCLGIRC